MKSGTSARAGRVVGPKTATAVVAPLRPAVWTVLAVTALGLSVVAVGLRPWYSVQVRLTWEHRLPATTVLAAMAGVGVVSALVGRKRECLGLFGLASLSFGAAVIWLLLSNHRFAGPVILELADRHGFHLTDLLALAPVGVGIGLTARMVHVLWAARRARGSFGRA